MIAVDGSVPADITVPLIPKPRLWRKKTLIIFSIAAFVGLIGWCVFHFFLQSRAKVYYWRTSMVERGDVNVMVTSTGSLNADTSVDVGVQVSGTIARIMVDFNSIVNKGQVIAVMDTALLYASKVDAKAAMLRADIQNAESRREFVRAKRLFDSLVSDQADFDLARTAYQTANGNLVSARAQLSRANINLQFATIKAPISGMVISRNIQIGNMVIASFNSPTLFTIANDLRKMQVQANVDEADIGQVKTGQKVKFTVDAYPKDVFTGIITQVRRQPVVVQNVVNYVVIVAVPNPEMKLVPGLTANLNIYVEERKDVLKVPANAFNFIPPLEYIQSNILLSDSVKRQWEQIIQKKKERRKQEIVDFNYERGFVWMMSEKDLYPVEVTRGLSDGTSVEVIGVLQQGQEVVVGINQSVGLTDNGKAKSPFMPTFPSRKKP